MHAQSHALMHLDALVAYPSAVLNIYVGYIPCLYTAPVYMYVLLLTMNSDWTLLRTNKTSMSSLLASLEVESSGPSFGGLPDNSGTPSPANAYLQFLAWASIRPAEFFHSRPAILIRESGSDNPAAISWYLSRTRSTHVRVRTQRYRRSASTKRPG